MSKFLLKFTVILILTATCMPAFAFWGLGWHVIIKNNSNSSITVYRAGEYWWDSCDVKGYEEKTTIEPKKSQSFYCEEKFNPFIRGRLMGFDVNVLSNGKTIHYELSHDKPFGKDIVDSKTIKVQVSDPVLAHTKENADSRRTYQTFSVGRSLIIGTIDELKSRNDGIYCEIMVE